MSKTPKNEELYLSFFQERIAIIDATKTIERLEAENERLRDFAESVVQWSEAYPEDVFIPPTDEDISAMCLNLGMSLTRISAMVLRSFTKPWGDRAREALKGGE